MHPISRIFFACFTRISNTGFIKLLENAACFGLNEFILPFDTTSQITAYPFHVPFATPGHFAITGPFQEHDMSMKTLAMAAILLLTSGASLRADQHVVNNPLGFQLIIPDGFVQEDFRATGKMLHVFRRPASGDGQATYIFVSRLDGTIGREKISSKQAAAVKPGMTILSDKWRSFDVEVFRIADIVEGRQTVRLHAQIPLAGEAIQIGVMGDQVSEPELKLLLHGLLTHLEGRSNWLSVAERSDRALYLVAGGLVAIFVFALGRLRMARERNAPEMVGNRKFLAGGGAACSVCGAPLAKAGATKCNICGAPQKSANGAERLVGKCMLWGLACGAVLGGMWGYDFIAKEWAGALGGALVMSLVGMFLGLFAALVGALVKRLNGKVNAAESPTWTFNSSTLLRNGLDDPYRS